MTLGKLIGEALALCESIVEAEDALGNLGVNTRGYSDAMEWLRWASNSSPDKDPPPDLACDSDAAKLIRDQLYVPRVQKLLDLVKTEVSTTTRRRGR